MSKYRPPLSRPLVIACLGVASGLLLLLNGQPTRAGTVTFKGNGTTAGGSVDATAQFTTSANTLTIVLRNNTLGTVDISQVLTGLQFNVSGSLTGSLFGGTGVEADIKGNGSYTGASLQNIAPHWALTHTGNPFNLNTVPGAGGQPYDGIIGPGDAGSNLSSGTFPFANGSIAANNPHNPLVLTTATFTLTIIGLTENSSITDAVFQFGSMAGSNLVTGVPDANGIQGVPEPGAMTLLGIGIAGMAGYGWRRKCQEAHTKAEADLAV